MHMSVYACTGSGSDVLAVKLFVPGISSAVTTRTAPGTL